MVGIVPDLAAFEQAFEQYGLYLSFPLLSFLPHWLHVERSVAGFSGEDVLRRFAGGSSESLEYRCRVTGNGSVAS